MIPKHFSLVGDHDGSYELHDSRDDRKFHVAKRGLSLDMLGKLAKIQKFDGGGQVKDSKEKPPAGYGETIGGKIGYPGAEKYVKLDKPQGYADGGEVKKEKEEKPPEGQGRTLGGRIGYPGAEKYVKIDKKPEGYAGGGIAGVSDSSGPVMLPQLPPPIPVAPSQVVDSSSGLMATSGSGGLPPPPIESIDQIPATPLAPAPIAAQSPEGSPANIQMSAQDPLIDRRMGANLALDAERAALLGGTQAEAQAGAQTASAYNKMVKQMESMKTPEQYQQQYKAADDKLAESFRDTTINPDRYWHNKSTGAKIQAGIGMILGGLGSGMTGGPNLAVEAINKAIERDMDSQRLDQSKNLNLWKMNREGTQNDISANLTTQNQMLNIVRAKVLQYAAQASGAEAKAKLAPMIAEIDQRMGVNNFHKSMLSASNNTMGGGIASDPAMMIDIVPEKDRAAVSKEISEAKNYVQARDHVLSTFEQIKKINTVANRAKSPLQTSRQVDALRNVAAMSLAKMSGSGQLSDEERKVVEAAYTGVGDSAETDAVKLENIKSIMDQKKPQSPLFKSATGIDLDKFQSTNPAMADPLAREREAQILYALQNANNPDPAVQQRVSYVRQKYGI